jgi:hypothetical protein
VAAAHPFNPLRTNRQALREWIAVAPQPHWLGSQQGRVQPCRIVGLELRKTSVIARTGILS